MRGFIHSNQTEGELVRRVFWLLLILGLGGSYMLVSKSIAPQTGVAHHADGERWYRIEQNSQHIGYMHNSVRGFALTTQINYQPPDAPAVVINQQLHFAATAPSLLQRAAYSQRIGEQYSAVSLRPDHVVGNAPTYTATIIRNGSVSQARFKGFLKLEDMYAVESWLHSEPTLGSTLSAPYVDFEKLQISQREHRLLAQDARGYDLTGAHSESATQTRLDRNYLAVKLTMAGRYDVSVSSRREAIPTNQPKVIAPSPTQRFTVDKALVERQRLLELKLQVVGDSALPASLVGRPGTLSANAADAGLDAYLAEHIDFPIQHPKIRSLLQDFARSSDDEADAQRLVAFTHSQLSYAEHKHADTVLTALAQRRGECNDFADLYTTLARSAGLPARTVYGLAYDASGTPSFRFHAWNEVYADEQWHSVDPTWNQIITDATHIPLSDEQYADLLRARVNAISFKVTGTRYQAATL